MAAGMRGLRRLLLPAGFHGRSRVRVAAAAAAAAAGAAAAVTSSTLCSAQGRTATDLDKGYVPRTTNPLAVIRKRAALPRVPGEPEYTTDEVSSHNSADDMWVTYKDGVYDVTEFASVRARFLSPIRHAGAPPPDLAAAMAVPRLTSAR